jgi:membrane fusion protein (multidrug efflux system)
MSCYGFYGYPMHACRYLLAPVLLLLVACGQEQPRGGPGGGFQPRPTQVEVVAAQMREISQRLEAIGTAQANESVTITAKVTDTISAVRFEDGQLVEQGQVLVELTDVEEAALLREAEANVADAQLQRDRLVNLFRQGSVPKSQADEASARYDAALARQQSLMARLNDRLVRAPFSGLLGFRLVSDGSLLTPSTPITTIDDVSLIKLDFSVAEVHLGIIEPGQQLIAQSAAFPDREFTATVKTIGSRVDPVTRSAVIRAHIDNDDLSLRPGMFMTVHLTTDVRQAMMVPERALVQRGSSVLVYTVSPENRAILTAVELGAQDGLWVEITSGIELGDQVVTDGILKLRNNAPVLLPGQKPSPPAGRPGATGGRPGGKPPSVSS